MPFHRTQLGRALGSLAVCLSALCWVGNAGAQAPSAFTNDDVVKLTAAGLGANLIIAKIAEAPLTEFRLEPDDLIALKRAGIDESVIEAMLERGSGLPSLPSAGSAATGSAPALGGSIATPMGPMVVGAGTTRVWIVTPDGNLPLTGILGESSMVWAYVTTFTYLNFAGVDAGVRVAEQGPDLLVVSEGSPTGRFYIAKLERDVDDGVRSLKMGRSSPFSPQLAMTPDPDWLVPFEAIDEGRGYWRLRPKKALGPGEYGVLVRGSQELFDFGVDGGEAGPDDSGQPRWKVWKRGKRDSD